MVRAQVLESDGDAVNRYVTLLTAQDTLYRLEADYPDFFRRYPRERKGLHRQLNEVEALKEELTFGSAEARARFIGWFERMFFTDMRSAG